MAVTSVLPLWSGRRGSDNVDRRRQYTTEFEVIVSDATDDPTVAGGTLLLPRLGDPYPFDFFALCVELEPVNTEETPYRYIVTAKYDTQLPIKQGKEATGYDSSGAPTQKSDPTDRPENPLDREPIYKTGWVEQTKTFDVDQDNTKVLNSAGFPYDPPLTTTRRNWTISVTKNLAGMSYADQTRFSGVTNEDTWRGFPPETLRTYPIEIDPMQENGLSFVQVKVTIEYDPDTWRRFVFDSGLWQKVTTLGVTIYSRIRDPLTGNESSTPQFLDGSGLQLTAGDDPVFFPEEGYKEWLTADFNELMTILGIS